MAPSSASPAAEARGLRFERKFLVETLSASEMVSLVRLHPALFLETYPPRWINNLYLDSAERASFDDNVAGIADRVKVRIRWYGDLFGALPRPVLERKHKHGLLGGKEAYPLPPFTMAPGFDRDRLARVLAGADLPPAVREALATLEPHLLNRYRRRYYRSADGRIRLTLDDRREVRRAGPRNNAFVTRREDRRSVILELKYAPEDDARAVAIANRFPFRLTKSSKYVDGLAALAPA